MGLSGVECVDLYLRVDPAGGIKAGFTVTLRGRLPARGSVGATASVPSGWFTGATAPAVGLIDHDRRQGELPGHLRPH